MIGKSFLVNYSLDKKNIMQILVISDKDTFNECVVDVFEEIDKHEGVNAHQRLKAISILNIDQEDN